MSQIFIFGDSITWGAWDLEHSGWVQRLRLEADRHQCAVQGLWQPIYNLGISGDTSAGLVRRMRGELIARHESTVSSVVVVAIGINDSQRSLDGSRHEISATAYHENLKSIASIAHEFTTQVYFVGLTPIQDELLNPNPWDASVSYRLSQAQEFDQVLTQFADENSLPLISLMEEWTNLDFRQLLSDGLHPNAAGHERTYQRVRSRLVFDGIIDI